MDPVEGAHSEPPHLDLHCLPSVFWIFNPLYTGGVFQYYMLDESVSHFRGVRSILSLLFYF